MIEKWRVEYNTSRPHSALGYRPPAPAACSTWMSNSSSQPMAVIFTQRDAEVNVKARTRWPRRDLSTGLHSRVFHNSGRLHCP